MAVQNASPTEALKPFVEATLIAGAVSSAVLAIVGVVALARSIQKERREKSSARSRGRDPLEHVLGWGAS